MQLFCSKEFKILVSVLAGCLTLLILPCLSLAQSVGNGQVPIGLISDDVKEINRAAALEGKAKSEYNSGDYSRAHFDAEQAFFVLKGSYCAEILGDILEAQGKYSEELDVYSQELPTTDRQILLPYAAMSLKEGNWDDALSAYGQVVVGQTNDLSLATDIDRRANFRLLTAAAQFTKYNPRPAEMAAIILIMRGIYLDQNACFGSDNWRAAPDPYNPLPGRALNFYEQAMVIEPNSALPLYFYGRGLEIAGRKEDATKALSKAAAPASGFLKDVVNAQLAKAISTPVVIDHDIDDGR
jgi:tetratricopeptide (TPR) repeat protein